MATFRFLHCADLHLDSPLRGLEDDPDAPVETIRRATRRALENLVGLILRSARAGDHLAVRVTGGPGTVIRGADQYGHEVRNQ